MKEQKKKRLIVFLLLISCVISGIMLFTASEEGSRQLRNLAQADSLIQQELAAFNISDEQIRLSSTRIDSSFRRKTYHIGLPYQFSKTQFHAELNSRLHPYGVKTPAQVTFPERNVDIHLLYRGTVIRTLALQTDPELVMNRNHMSLLFVFDQLPKTELINRIANLGEPIPIAIKIENPMQANEIRKQMTNYPRLLFWLQNREGKDLIRNNTETAVTKLRQIQEVLPSAHILQFQYSKKIRRKIAEETDLTFISAANALMLHRGIGKASFFEELHKLQANRNHSIAVITGNETTISWLEEKLPELKKAGTTLIPPPQTNY
ncbi:MAG: hypothetical protein U5J63_11235 [Fodinibius sp.]|nr:hypothetical protein [Fodinibius sp.]